MLPPKKRQQQQAQQQENEVFPVPAEASKPEPSEEGDKATANNGQEASIADVEPTSIVGSVAVETSKIRGTAPPRKPRVGEQYQAELPQLVEQPHKR